MANKDEVNFIEVVRKLLEKWSGKIWKENHPATKNRIQALGEVRDRMQGMNLAGNFEETQKQLMKLIETCREEFDPAFDTEYGSGVDMFGSLESMLYGASSEEEFIARLKETISVK